MKTVPAMGSQLNQVLPGNRFWRVLVQMAWLLAATSLTASLPCPSPPPSSQTNCSYSCQLSGDQLLKYYESEVVPEHRLDLVRIISPLVNLTGVFSEAFVGFPRDTRNPSMTSGVNDVCVARKSCDWKRTIYDLNEVREGVHFPRYLAVTECQYCDHSAVQHNLFPARLTSSIGRQVQVTACPSSAGNHPECDATNTMATVEVLRQSEESSGWESEQLKVTVGCYCSEQ